MQKKFIPFYFLFVCTTWHCPSEPEYTVEFLVYNNRLETVLDCSRGIYQREEDKCLPILPNETIHYIDNHLPEKEPLSKGFVYFRITLEDGTEILNLRGEALDSAGKTIKETEYHITYRLDVN